MTKKQLDRLLKKLRVGSDEIEWLYAKRKDFRRDVIYSPIRIYYELTLACNRCCRYCFNSSGRPRKNELTPSEMLKSLDHLKESNVLDIRFSGGEPTSRSDWFQIMKYARELGFATSCNTNAAYSDRSVCEKFRKLDLDLVTVSIDGNKEHYEFNRGVGTFNNTIANLKLMHSLGVTLRINVLVNKYSMNDVEFMLDLASKYANEINFFTIIFIGRGAHLESTDAVTVEDHLRMSQKIRELKPKYPNLNILHFAEVSRKTSVNEETNQKFGLKIGPPSGTTTFNITSDGGYYCGGYTPYIDPDSCLGNIKTDNLFDVWQKNPLLEKRRDEGKKLILFCNKCKKYINGECQGSEYETELNRLINPEVKNPTCIYGDGPSLLALKSDI